MRKGCMGTWALVLAGLSACGGGTDGGSTALPESALIETRGEPAGANCPAGGDRVRQGTDANANGVLEESEISTTAYVCDAGAGASASAGPAGRFLGTQVVHGATLTCSSTEAATKSCSGVILLNGVPVRDSIVAADAICQSVFGTEAANAGGGGSAPLVYDWNSTRWALDTDRGALDLVRCS